MADAVRMTLIFPIVFYLVLIFFGLYAIIYEIKHPLPRKKRFKRDHPTASKIFGIVVACIMTLAMGTVVVLFILHLIEFIKADVEYVEGTFIRVNDGKYITSIVIDDEHYILMGEPKLEEGKEYGVFYTPITKTVIHVTEVQE